MSYKNKGKIPWNKGLKLPPSNNKKTGFCVKSICEFCKLQFTTANLSKHEVACSLNPKNNVFTHHCKNCNTSFISRRQKSKVFCSYKCTYEYKRNQVKSRICCNCKQSFPIRKGKWNRKTCSSKCLSEYVSEIVRLNPNCGARVGFKSNKSKRIYHKNILLDSSWELQLAIWLDENEIEWHRDRRLFFRWTDNDGKRRRYTPDFYLPKLEIYLDPKNSYLMKLDKDKMNRVRSEHGIVLIAGAVKYVKGRVRRKIFQQAVAHIDLIN